MLQNLEYNHSIFLKYLNPFWRLLSENHKFNYYFWRILSILFK